MVTFTKCPLDADRLEGAFSDRLGALHETMQRAGGLSQIGRISVATYQPVADELRTFATSDRLGQGARGYHALLRNIPSLGFLKQRNEIRVIGSIPERLLRKGTRLGPDSLDAYRSSMALPVRKGDEFYGFCFFNSDIEGFFTPEVIDLALPFGLLVGQMMINEIDGLKALRAAVQTAKDIGRLRDNESSEHLQRMACYCGLIARSLSRSHGLTDEWIEHLEHFAPLHDIGKVGIPDRILLKSAPLNAEETGIMQGHVRIGMDIVETTLGNFGLGRHPFSDLLRNIVAHHHEAIDGTGYPLGLSGGDISIEGRVAAVADIFDTLTSPRPYKFAWAAESAFAHLNEIAGTRLDPACVEALLENRRMVEDIMERTRKESG